MVCYLGIRVWIYLLCWMYFPSTGAERPISNATPECPKCEIVDPSIPAKCIIYIDIPIPGINKTCSICVNFCHGPDDADILGLDLKKQKNKIENDILTYKDFYYKKEQDLPKHSQNIWTIPKKLKSASGSYNQLGSPDNFDKFSTSRLIKSEKLHKAYPQIYTAPISKEQGKNLPDENMQFDYRNTYEGDTLTTDNKFNANAITGNLDGYDNAENGIDYTTPYEEKKTGISFLGHLHRPDEFSDLDLHFINDLDENPEGADDIFQFGDSEIPSSFDFVDIPNTVKTKIRNSKNSYFVKKQDQRLNSRKMLNRIKSRPNKYYNMKRIQKSYTKANKQNFEKLIYDKRKNRDNFNFIKKDYYRSKQRYKHFNNKRRKHVKFFSSLRRRPQRRRVESSGSSSESLN